jgi:hypothetical protein
MTRRGSDGPGAPETRSRTSRTAKSHRSARGLLSSARGLALIAALAVSGLGAIVANASGDGTVTLPGGPLVVSVGSLGECESNYPNVGNNFYPASGTLGDCGFFLGFPAGVGNPAALEQTSKTGSVFGFTGSAGPDITDANGGVLYTAILQGPTSGSGSTADPYSEITTFKASIEGKDYALVTVTTTYVSGAANFTSTYDVENVTGQSIPGLTPATPAAALHFHAIAAGDLYVADDDHGTGVFLGGPPRFIGGQNNTTGTLGGFIENTSSLPWTNFQEGEWNSVIWEAVRDSTAATPVFDDTVDPTLIDNGAGVSWDQFLTGAGLLPGAHATFSILNRTQVPTTLGVQPVTQTHTVGQTATVTVTATDTLGTPYAGRPVVYSIGGANPKSGSVTTNASGVATISYVGTAAGLDTMQMFLDLAGTGTQAPQDPSAAAQLTWAPAPPAPPTPTSSYKVQSIHANSNGTITIVFVPTQEGTAVVEVTVPTATISRNEAIAAKAKKCKRNQIKIKGKCRPKSTVSSKVSATGKAGVPLKLTIKPSSKVKKALSKGKKVQLTAKLTYKSKLGGTPTVQVFHFTVKAPKKHKKHH